MTYDCRLDGGPGGLSKPDASYAATSAFVSTPERLDWFSSPERAGLVLRMIVSMIAAHFTGAAPSAPIGARFTFMTPSCLQTSTARWPTARG